jgi:hypothetical protein
MLTRRRSRSLLAARPPRLAIPDPTPSWHRLGSTGSKSIATGLAIFPTGIPSSRTFSTRSPTSRLVCLAIVTRSVPRSPGPVWLVRLGVSRGNRRRWPVFLAWAGYLLGQRRPEWRGRAALDRKFRAKAARDSNVGAALLGDPCRSTRYLQTAVCMGGRRPLAAEGKPSA